MAPNLRSLRSSSRTTTSQNPSRPATPQDAPAPAAPAASATPNSGATEPARPRKQRRTGRNSRVAVNAEASGSGEGQNDNEDTNETAQLGKRQWKEPTPAPPKISTKDYHKNPFDDAPVTKSMQPLGTMPTARQLRAAKIVPARLPPSHPASKGTKRKVETDAMENGAKRPKTATTSVEGPGQTDSSRAEGSEGPLGREERETRSTRSNTGNNNPATEAPATTNGHGPAVPSVPTSRSRDRLSEIVEAAIAKAESQDDLPVSRGLRRIWDASGTDPFLLTVLDAVLNHNADAHQRSVFQTVMRDASREVQTGGQSGEPMARTQSDSSTSSLSSAKSLDPETFAPTMASGTAPTNSGAKGKAAKAASSKAKGKGRAGPRRGRSTLPTRESSLTRKRALEEDDPDFSEEAVAAKRRALELSSTGAAVVDGSEVRTQVGPDPDAELPVPSPHDVARWELEREASGAGVDLGLDADSLNANGVHPAPYRETATTARSEEIDNNDFCRVCNGSGQLLCCDGCVDSFHFTCLDPPVNPDSPPEGQWFCPACSVKGPFGVLIEEMERTTQTSFSLPASLRTRFEGVREDDVGRYDEVFVQRPGASRTRLAKKASAQEQRDSKGNLIVCFRCRQTSDKGRRQVIQCDYCPLSWHLDCLDTPRANPPQQKAGNDVKAKETWRCPNHIEHDLAPVASCGGRVGRARRARDPQIVDVDVVVQDSDAERFLERDSQGTVFRVSERGLMLNFIDRVKRDAAEKRAADALVKSNTSRQNAENVTVLDESNQDAVATPGASNTGATQSAAAVDDAATVSSPVPENEAAMNLVALSQTNQASERAGILIQQMTEVEHLRSLQELIDRRIQALNSGAVSPNS